jgi:hypothetical protein
VRAHQHGRRSHDVIFELVIRSVIIRTLIIPT